MSLNNAVIYGYYQLMSEAFSYLPGGWGHGFLSFFAEEGPNIAFQFLQPRPFKCTPPKGSLELRFTHRENVTCGWERDNALFLSI